MGLLRWATIIGTGGLAPIKGTAPRERTAKAAEKQARLQKQMLKASQQTTTAPTLRPAVQAQGEQKTFDVLLTAVDPAKKIATTKVIYEATGLPLRESKAIVDHPPSVVKEWTGEAEANALKARLEDLGATSKLKPSRSESATSAVGQTDDGFARELGRLADLHGRGALTDEEFAAAKAKILGPKS